MTSSKTRAAALDQHIESTCLRERGQMVQRLQHEEGKAAPKAQHDGIECGADFGY